VLSLEDKPKRHRSAREISIFLLSAQDNSPQSPAQMLQMTSCDQLLSEANHLLINSLIVFNRSCYCSILNRKLCNK